MHIISSLISGTTKLSDHTAYLPDATTRTGTSATDGFAGIHSTNQGKTTGTSEATATDSNVTTSAVNPKTITMITDMTPFIVCLSETNIP